MTKPRRARKRKTSQTHIYRRLILAGVFVFSILFIPNLGIHAANLSNASLAIADTRPSTLSTNYTFTSSNVTIGAPGTIKCIKELFSDTSGGVNSPTGMATNGGGVTFDTVGSNYMPTPGAWTLNKPANGTLTLTNAAGEIPASTSARKVSINGITNPSTADTKYWLKFSTYNNTDCVSSPVDFGETLFILTNGSTLSLTVDDTLAFTVNTVIAGQPCDGTTTTAASTPTTIPFGTVTAASNAVVCQDLTAATNASNGYTIYARYVAKPTNALGQTIADEAGTNLAPVNFTAAGTEGYGYSTNSSTLSPTGNGANRFTNPSQNWAAMTTTNSEVAYTTVPSNPTTVRVGHQVGVSTISKPGTYTTTIIYTCTPIY